MNNMHVRRRRTVVAAGLACAAVLWGSVGGGSTAIAFDHPWTLQSCIGVPAGGNGFWDDAPGAGVNMESVFAWVNNAVAGDEQCTWASAVPGISSTSFPSLQVRAAVNDSARLTVRVVNSLNVVIATAGLPVNNAFNVVNVTIPPGHLIRQVRVTLDDAPDAAVASRRSSALVDYIRIMSPTGAVGWQEQFSRVG